MMDHRRCGPNQNYYGREWPDLLDPNTISADVNVFNGIGRSTRQPKTAFGQNFCTNSDVLFGFKITTPSCGDLADSLEQATFLPPPDPRVA